jgi:hypothetical protein
LFIGTREDAYEAALRDTEQYEIAEFIVYRGEPMIRTSMEFYIRFSDGCYHWKYWSPDLFFTVQYDIVSVDIQYKLAAALIREINVKPILSVSPGTTVFIDLRGIGCGWYESLNLSNSSFAVYIVPLTYGQWQNVNHTKIQCSIPSLDIHWHGRASVNTYFLRAFGNSTELQENISLCSLDFISEHDLIIKQIYK